MTLRAQRFVLPALGVFVSSLALFVGCKKDEPPPPLPSATVATTAPPEPLRLAPEEDAGTPEPDAAVGGGTRVGGGGSSLKKCCDALMQNAQNAPEPNKSYMLTAGQACNAAVAAGTGNAGVLTIVQNALRGANLPSACK